jgi:DNA mismatch endonuclease (patch repair protein)
MLSNRAKNTKPELLLRSALHSMGFRFRLHGRGLPGTPDVVFAPRKKAVWLHGCFWHSHPGCRYATVPKTRSEYWIPKLARNRARDAEHTWQLHDMGWGSLVVWQCELKDMEAVRGRLKDFLGPPRYGK